MNRVERVEAGCQSKETQTNSTMWEEKRRKKRSNEEIDREKKCDF